MAGGDGDDTYVKDVAGDVVTEFDGQGVDTVKTSVSLVAIDHVENYIFTGSAAVDFTGTIEAVKPERSRLRVTVRVFGRPIPVELDFLQVEAL